MANEAPTGNTLPAEMTPELELYRQRLVNCVCGEGIEAACRIYQLDRSQIEQWQMEEWWGVASRRFYSGQAQALDRKFTKLIDMALEKAEKRLETGDEVLDRFGETQIVPIKGKDAAAIAALFMDRRQIVRGLPNTIVKSETSLDAIAEKLRSIVRSDPATAMVLDATKLVEAAIPTAEFREMNPVGQPTQPASPGAPQSGDSPLPSPQRERDEPVRTSFRVAPSFAAGGRKLQ